MSDFGKSSRYHVRNGFLVRHETAPDFARSRARALDHKPFSPTDEEEDPEDILEIHNHIIEEPNGYYDRASAGDDEGPDEEGREGEEVARYPASGYTVLTEDDESGAPHHVVYRSAGEGRAPSHKTDILEMGDSGSRARDSRSHAPRTLAQLNAFNAAHYKAKAGRR